MTLNQMQVERVPNQAELVARAEALLPGLHERARAAEESRRLSDDTVGEFRAAEFHKIPPALVGMANGMAEAVRRTLIGKKALFSGELQVERVANQMKLIEALTDIHAAELIMRHRLTELMRWGEAGAPPSTLDALSSQRDASYVSRLMGKVANNLALMFGATSINLSNPIQRYQRDINAGVTHVSLVWEEAAENYGRALWELPGKAR